MREELDEGWAEQPNAAVDLIFKSLILQETMVQQHILYTVLADALQICISFFFLQMNEEKFVLTTERHYSGSRPSPGHTERQHSGRHKGMCKVIKTTLGQS